MGSTVTETNINYEMYLDGSRLLGTVQITQPNVQAMTTEIKGAGIAGAADVPILGHIQDMSGTVQFRTVKEDISKLLTQQYLHLEFWAAVQTLDPSTGKYIVKQHKIIWRAMPKGTNLGTTGVGEAQNREIEFNIVYLKEFYDNKLVIEIDKFNYIYKVGDDDLLSSVKKVLGL
jgi:P2 family phage contractile tail tube protein